MSKKERILNDIYYPLLLDCLAKPCVEEDFPRYVDEHKIGESVEFLVELEILNNIYKQAHEQIAYLYKQFISKDAVQPINIDNRISSTIKHHLDKNEFSENLFVEAGEHIQLLLLSDSIPTYAEWIVRHEKLDPLLKRTYAEQLCNAAFNNKINECEELLNHPHIKEFIDFHNNRDQTALYCAARNGNKKILLSLLKTGFINVNRQISANGSTALHAASWYGHSECIILLLVAGGDFLIKNSNNLTAKQDTLKMESTEAFEEYEASSEWELQQLYPSVKELVDSLSKFSKPHSKKPLNSSGRRKSQKKEKY